MPLAVSIPFSCGIGDSFDFRLLAFDTASVGIVLAESRVIRACNDTFAQLVGYRVADLVGQSFRKLYGSEDEFQRMRDIGLGALMREQSYTDERLLRHRDGRSVWCRGYRTSPLLLAPGCARNQSRQRKALGPKGV